jgi:hypothetical protein
MRGYLSRYSGLTVEANPHIDKVKEEERDKVGTHKVILQLWDFADGMWEYQNAILHNTKLKESQKIDDDINDEIKKLYEKVESYNAEDRWYFEMPLILPLKKPQ